MHHRHWRQSKIRPRECRAAPRPHSRGPLPTKAMQWRPATFIASDLIQAIAGRVQTGFDAGHLCLIHLSDRPVNRKRIRSEVSVQFSEERYEIAAGNRAAVRFAAQGYQARMTPPASNVTMASGAPAIGADAAPGVLAERPQPASSTGTMQRADRVRSAFSGTGCKSARWDLD